MASYILIPATNPVKHVEKDIVSTDNTFLFDKYNYAHTVQEYEGYLPYKQPWVVGDKVHYQIWLKDVDDCNIDILDCSGKLIRNVPMNITLSGYLINDVLYNICQFVIDTSDLLGDYFFIINYQKTGNPTIYKRVSEPQEVVAELKPSILLKYSHRENDYGTIYKTSFNTFFEQYFYLRVAGRIKHEKPANMREVYEDQLLDLTALSSKPYDIWKFFFGSGYGIPDWMGSKLNMLISHSTITADENQFTFIDELDKKSSGYYTRYLYEISARFSEIKYAQQLIVPEPPTSGGLQLPDGTENVPYTYMHAVNGTTPFTLSSIVKPAWMNITVSGNNIVFSGTPGSGDVGTSINVSFNVNNSVGTLVLTDDIDVIAAASCVSVSFTSTPSIPNAVAGQPYNAFIALNGTNPYILSSIVKPAWATIVSEATGIRITGTPPSADPTAGFSFDISNCGGGPLNIITFTQVISVSSGVIITGNTSFSIGLPSGSGNIIAPPGTLVTVTINANGASGSYTLNTSITGATVTGSTNITNGSTNYTFIMPGSGSVGWSGSFTAPNSAGGGSIAAA